jgi:hypothetical protein
MINVEVYLKSLYYDKAADDLKNRAVNAALDAIKPYIIEKINYFNDIYKYFNSKSLKTKSTKLLITKQTIRILENYPDTLLGKRLLNKFKTPNRLLREGCPNFINIGPSSEKDKEVKYWTEKSFDNLLKRVIDALLGNIANHISSKYRYGDKESENINFLRQLAEKRVIQHALLVQELNGEQRRTNNIAKVIAHKIFSEERRKNIINITISMLLYKVMPDKECSPLGVFANKLFDVLEAKKEEKEVYSRVVGDLENISAEFDQRRVKRIQEINKKVQTFTGQFINYLYKEIRQVNTGRLGNSCMRYTNRIPRQFELYAKNPDTIKLACYIKDNKVAGRVIVYKTKEEKWKYSVVYPADRQAESVLRMWLKTNNIEPLTDKDEVYVKPHLYTRVSYVDKLPILETSSRKMLYLPDVHGPTLAKTYQSIQCQSGETRMFKRGLAIPIWSDLIDGWVTPRFSTDMCLNRLTGLYYVPKETQNFTVNDKFK